MAAHSWGWSWNDSKSVGRPLRMIVFGIVETLLMGIDGSLCTASGRLIRDVRPPATEKKKFNEGRQLVVNMKLAHSVRIWG